VFHVLLVVTFAVHILFINMLLDGSFSVWYNPSASSRATRRTIARAT
jgi:hypothetical protein